MSFVQCFYLNFSIVHSVSFTAVRDIARYSSYSIVSKLAYFAVLALLMLLWFI